MALAVHLLWLLNQSALYQALYTLVDLPASIHQLLPIVLASNFINFSTPSASLGGLVLFLSDARQRGLDSGRVVLVNFLFLLLNLMVCNYPCFWLDIAVCLARPQTLSNCRGGGFIH